MPKKTEIENLIIVVLSILEACFDLILGSSLHKKIQIMGRKGEHITDIYITETGTTELENLSHNIIDIFIIET